MKIISKRDKKTLDKLTYVIGILIPIFTIPQAINVLFLKEVEGVSLITWGFYLVSSSLFAIFGFIHREKLLIFTYTPLVIIEILIIVGIIIHS